MSPMGTRPTHTPPKSSLTRPKTLREVPGYLKKLVRGFLSRLFYIISLVWESAPLLLILMCLACLFEGVLPVIGAYITKDILNGVASLIGTASLGNVYNDVFVQLKPIIFLLGLYFVYTLLRRVVSKVGTMASSLAGERVVNHIKLKIMKKADEIDIPSFDKPEFYEKLENANREAGMRPIGILTATLNCISSAISLVSFIVVLATLHPWAPLLIILGAVPGAIVNYRYRYKNYRYIRFHSKERREMNYYSGMMVNKDLAKEVRILGLGGEFDKKYKQSFVKYYKGLKKLIVKEGVAQILTTVVTTIVNFLLFLYIAYNIVFLGGEIGDWSLYTGALTSIASAVSVVLTSTATIYEGTLFIENMISFMNEEIYVKPSVSEPLLPQRGAPHKIEFKNVSFCYPGSNKYVLKNINLTLEPCEAVVLVGLNGAGKTTLIKLLTRLYDVSEGEILLDGHNIKEYDTKALYAMFGIIFQDFGKYATTAGENISYGDIDKGYVEGDVILSAERGGADGFISELPLGYNTPLTRMFEETGIELSGGQWQKLSVARAFYKEADILILDEPTASLDAISEAQVYKRFAELSEDKITVFVSHRLSSAASADKIVVLKDGEIVELGNHRELMEKGGEYARMFNTQAERYITK